jgi:hypothetical protein
MAKSNNTDIIISEWLKEQQQEDKNLGCECVEHVDLKDASLLHGKLFRRDSISSNGTVSGVNLRGAWADLFDLDVATVRIWGGATVNGNRILTTADLPSLLPLSTSAPASQSLSIDTLAERLAAIEDWAVKSYEAQLEYKNECEAKLAELAATVLEKNEEAVQDE